MINSLLLIFIDKHMSRLDHSVDQCHCVDYFVWPALVTDYIPKFTVLQGVTKYRN